MSNFIRRHPYVIGGGVVLIAGLAWLVFGYFAVHTLFIDDVVSETAPVVDREAPTYSGAFSSDAHATSGTALVLESSPVERFLRFEQFETSNGPDLNVYLVNSSTGDESDFVDLGDLKGNIGEQNYAIPSDTDLDVYDKVVIWCVRFGVAFGNAPLVAA